MLLARNVLLAAYVQGSRRCPLRSFGVRYPLVGAASYPSAEMERGNRSVLRQSVRNYAKASRRKQEFPSQLDDLPPTMLKKDYAKVEIANSVDDVVRRLLSLEMASQKEKMKVKTQQLMEKVNRSPHDCGSMEAQIAVLTAKIRNYQEHVQQHHKDKLHKRKMLLAIDRRKKLLKYLRRTNYSTFEKVCQQLDIEYTFPPEYYRRVTRRWLAKKAFCLKVSQEVKKRRLAEQLKQEKIAEEKAAPIEGTPV
ncbi:small ribosomal subunit protein uS15m [Ambystoma mexicanum]|uniref:small ribosomal subunit protein uS15m n=1 Tax=Ambystoma mexicanum TaxID=8296 RepID=UPI0037E91074